MGGIWKKIPMTYALFWIGSLALAGVPWFAGCFSEGLRHRGRLRRPWMDGEIRLVLRHGRGNYLTAFYSWRLIIVTFHGEPRADHHTMEHIRESPR